MRKQSKKGSWYDMVRDNFWMMIALIYSGHETEANPVITVSNELEYLFDDSDEHNHHHMDVDVTHHIDFDDYDHHTDYFDHHHTDYDHHNDNFDYDDPHHIDFSCDDLDFHH